MTKLKVTYAVEFAYRKFVFDTIEEAWEFMKMVFKSYKGDDECTIKLDKVEEVEGDDF